MYQSKSASAQKHMLPVRLKGLLWFRNLHIVARNSSLASCRSSIDSATGKDEKGLLVP